MTEGSTATRAHVEFRDIAKSYGNAVQAVRDLNLDIRRGEFLTLLGPSGSGKTTALMMLAGFEEPSQGEILINGRRIDNVSPNRRGIGMVFQNYALFPHMTVAENLAFPLQVRRIGRAEVEERVKSLLEMVRLPSLGARRPDQLSGGQQQRIAVARALIFQPSLVLMDEPLGALDKQLREQMQYEIKEIHARLGVTFVYVTHDQTEALTMSDRIAVFNAGSVQQLSNPAELYERPQTSFVANFIGENNQFHGTIVRKQGDTAIVRLNDGADVVAMPVGEHPSSASAATIVSVRPERVSLLARAGERDNGFVATVRQVIYVGDHVRIICDVPGMGPIVLKTPNEAGRRDVCPGTEVNIGWWARDCLALAP
ncbi:ABC transporter ATP-binding protein [Mesorhizobium sp. NZP2298]|uniref:ABC transporter ATP-binding protein n=1 Tax=Mesorhizobium sp. NZP2298 TaxID=2483403 RepID=UPI001557F55F|nr:ABC transporter ATP-binding protein [Mesorhizobium sp. NZP2298]QKC97393.1 ABC transporter ATP-binding protein [Mesorhizobium sp. NZP2298]